jgi:putative aldouronate transport system substrate-binding protein
MKKLLVLFSVCALAAAIMLGGCNKGSGSADSGGEKKGALANGDVTFSMFYYGGLNANVTSFAYADNAFTKRLVDDTGINLDITSMSSADSPQRLNVMLNSGDYPDIIFGRQFSVAELDYYGAQQGIFIPLDQYNIRGYSGINQIMTVYPTLDLLIRGSDSKIYGLPRVNGCLHCLYRSGRTGYYMPFIRDNNRKMFETYDEFADYLRWVRDNDANGNGDKNDEIPMIWRAADTRNAITFFAKGFMPFVQTSTGEFGLALYDGKVVEQYRQSEFREALQFMAKLYSEKLIAPDSFTMGTEEARSLAYAEPPVVGAYGSGQLNGFMTTNSPRWLESFIMPVLKGKDGKQYAPHYQPWNGQSNFMSITTKAKDPKLAIELYDYMLSLEMQLLSNNSPKGYGWDDPDAGAIGLNGKPALWKQVTITSTGSTQTNLQWMNGNWTGFLDDWRYGIQATDIDKINRWLETGDPSLLESLTTNGSYNEAHNYIESLKMTAFEIPASYFIPPLPMSDADSARLADILVNLNTYLDQAIVEFVTGVRNINRDADWNTYNSDLERLGSKERADIIQKYLK